MLVLTRKYQEKIRIGDNVTITVLRSKGKAIRLGIEAPNDVPVIRGELAFEPAATDADAGTASLSAAGVSKPRTAARRAEAAASWPTDGHAPHVELKRMPRSDVKGFLPKLAAGSAPLRAMMDQRV